MLSPMGFLVTPLFLSVSPTLPHLLNRISQVCSVMRTSVKDMSMGSLDTEMHRQLNQRFQLDVAASCHFVNHINSRGLWYGDDPLTFALPLLLLQLSLITIFTRLIYLLLKPFGQPPIVSQILGGVLLGPSIIGHNSEFESKVFPSSGKNVLETLSVFGFMFFIFLIGVKMDPSIVLKSGKRALAIGVLGFFVPYALAGLVAIVLNYSLNLDREISSVLPSVVVLSSMATFPVIACFLAEIKILNSEIGRLACSSSVICDVCYWSIITVKYAASIASTRSLTTSIGSLCSVGLLIIFILFGIRPAALWAVRHTPEGKPVKDIYVFSVLVAVMFCGFMSQVIGLNIFVASFLLGLAIPDGPPLGAALVEKLDCFVSVLLMPIFFTICGLKMNVFAIQKFMNAGVILLIVLVTFLGKIIGTILPPLFCRMPFRDALSLGLIMNSKGIIELAILNNWKTDNVVNEECFTIMIISVVVVTGAISPLVKALYDPSKRFLAYKRRTVQHNRQNEELHVLACIHSQANVRAIVNILDVSNPTKDSPISLCVLHLIKLSGRAHSLLVAHHPRDQKPSQNPTQSEQIFNAFINLELEKCGNITVHCYKGISPYATMHNDVCSLALDKRTTLIIIPFHKQWIYGERVESSYALKHLNKNVLDKAPCSVGVLIDRGHRRKSRHLLVETSFYRIAMLFFGGADDREALAYARRMSGQPNVLLTVLKFAASTEIVGGTDRSKMLDAEILDDVRFSARCNDRVSYQEEKVTDGMGVLAVIRSMDNVYDLVMVGRRHGESRFMSDLRKYWNGRGELGTIGEILAATDFKGVSSVLVVQQQTRVWGMRDPEESTRLRRISM